MNLAGGTNAPPCSVDTGKLDAIGDFWTSVHKAKTRTNSMSARGQHKDDISESDASLSDPVEPSVDGRDRAPSTHVSWRATLTV